MQFDNSNERGQAIVEFALVIPVFLLIIFIIIELGWIGYQKNLFAQGYTHASWDITAEKLNDMDPLTSSNSVNTYSGSLVEDLIKDALKESSLWGFDSNNLVIRNARATLYNRETEFDVPGRVPGTATSAKSITRYMDISADLEYNIKPIMGLANFVNSSFLRDEKQLNYTRVVGTQKRSE